MSIESINLPNPIVCLTFPINCIWSNVRIQLHSISSHHSCQCRQYHSALKMPFSVTIARYTAVHFHSHTDLYVHCMRDVTCKAIHLPNEMRANCSATQRIPLHLLGIQFEKTLLVEAIHKHFGGEPQPDYDALYVMVNSSWHFAHWKGHQSCEAHRYGCRTINYTWIGSRNSIKLLPFERMTRVVAQLPSCRCSFNSMPHASAALVVTSGECEWRLTVHWSVHHRRQANLCI